MDTHPAESSSSLESGNNGDQEPIRVDLSLFQKISVSASTKATPLAPELLMLPYRMITEVISDLSICNLQIASNLITQIWSTMMLEFHEHAAYNLFKHIFRPSHLAGSWTDPGVLAYIYRKLKLCPELRQKCIEESPKACYPGIANQEQSNKEKSQKPVIRLVKNVISLTASSSLEMESMIYINTTCRDSIVNTIYHLFSENEKLKNTTAMKEDYEKWSQDFHKKTFSNNRKQKEPEEEEKEEIARKYQWINEQRWRRFSDVEFSKYVAFINQHVLLEVTDFETFMEQPSDYSKKIIEAFANRDRENQLKRHQKKVQDS